ncbi:hypothetical protein TWF192_003609 [Orbilia oligospora]|uniref:Nucleoporin Nup82 n=1 Tax=Orbilia oligospora TaxID=2813651 RepID=A0A6G1LR41_ORBOL|nr:hypothetical protein TWF191_006639 [Orbilia oligospora]KAF3231458.1 hypothetical protein TWF192_003609 [Orbilia oligospora]
MPGPVVSPILPEWLRENSLVSGLLSEPSSKAGFDNRKLPKKLFPSQKRTIFLRETELFVVHGKELRCADLKDLKAGSDKGEQYGGIAYQSLELPHLDFEISQIIRSADGETAVVVGEYDVGIALLPAPGVITLGARSKIALKCFKLETAPTQTPSRVLRAIFHPLGARPCVVVLTEDAMINVYEVEFNRESATVEPTETLDIKQMLGIDRNSSYLMDDIEPTSICFGGVGSIWSIFTLYILMRNGEIYSLCPFLPSKWMLDTDFLDELKYELQAHKEIRDSGDPAIPASDKHNSKQICFWVHEISRLIRVQSLANGHDEFDEEPVGYILSRPTLPDLITPLLQGPYLLQPAPEDNFDESIFASDIARVGAAHYAVIAVAWSSGKIDLMLEFESVAPRWHSTSLKYKKFNERTPYPVISGYETINIALPEATEGSSAIHPSFTVDINFPNTLLFSHGSGVEMLNLDDWMNKLTAVIDQEEDERAIETALAKSERTGVIHMIGGQKNAPRYPVVGTAMIYDAYLGYLLIGATTSKPAFAVLQLPSKYHTQMLKLKQERSDLSSTSSRLTPRPPIPVSRTSHEDAIASTEQRIRECRQRLLLAKQVIDPRLLKMEILVNNDHSMVLKKLKELLFDEMDARYENAQQIHAAAIQQQKRFHEQINNIRRFQKQLLEREKQQQEIREKLKKATDAQQTLKDKVDGILSKLSAISRKGGYSSMSQAEQEYVEELDGIEKITNQIAAKQRKIMSFVGTLSRTTPLAGDSQQAKPKSEEDQEAPDSNREELTKMVQKEHRLIIETKKKVEHLEQQFQEIRLST